MMSNKTELLSKLTIVIPTYNHPLRLERAVEYWRDVPVTVHIIDGSEVSNFDHVWFDDIANISYHHIPCEIGQNGLINGFKRQVYGSVLPKTEYSAVCADDDFYSVHQLASSIEFLDSDSLIDAVCGRVLTYSKLSSDKVVWWCKYLNWKDHTSARSNDLYERAFGAKNWFLYAVCRTDLWRKYINSVYTVRGYTDHQTYAHEWLLKQLSSSLFRVKFLEGISTIRQVTQVGENYVDEVPWETWLNDTRFKAQVDELIDQLARSLSLVSGNSDDCVAVAQRLVDEEIHNLSLHSEKKVSSRNLPWRTHLVQKKSLPDNFTNLIARLIPAERAVGLKSYQLSLIQKLMSRWGVSFDKSELEKIEQLLLKPREELRLRANI
jgi:glycosyltransferase domain-containing protein